MILKRLKIHFLFAIVFVGILTPNYLLAENKPQSVGLCSHVLRSTLMGNAITLGFREWVMVPASLIMRLHSKCKLNKALGCSDKLGEFENRRQMFQSMLRQISQETKDRMTISRAKHVYSLGKYGSVYSVERQEFSRDEFRSHFSENVPQRYRTRAEEAFDRMLDTEAILNWVEALRIEVLNRMWDDGLRDKAQYANPYLTAEYLDRVLAMRAKRFGFSISPFKKPWAVHTFSQIFFSATLARGRVFIDWTGANLGSNVVQSGHGARGHLLQMMYLAEHIDGLPGLIQFIGVTNDYHGIWAYLFDNAENTETSFWTGFWMDAFASYLNIPF